MHASHVNDLPFKAPSPGKFSEYATQFQPWHNLMKSTPNLVDELKHDKKERASDLKIRSMTAEGGWRFNWGLAGKRGGPGGG